MITNYTTAYKRVYDVIPLNVLIYTPPRIALIEKNGSSGQEKSKVVMSDLLHFAKTWYLMTHRGVHRAVAHVLYSTPLA